MTSEPITEPKIERKRRSGFRIFFCLVLTALIALGIGCRFYGLAWDDSRLLHPDERFLGGVVTKIKMPDSVGAYFNSTTSPLNPDNIRDTHYVYGQFPVVIGRWLCSAVNITADHEFLVYGRALSGVFDCLTILFSFLVGRRLLGWTGGFMSAAFVSLAALHIQQSHFFVVDTFAAAFMALGLWLIVRWSDDGRWWEAVGAGLACGLAMSCKISAFTLAFAVLPAVPLLAQKLGVKKALLGGFVLLFSALFAFRVANPMAFLGENGLFDLRLEPRYWNDLAQQSAITNGVANVPFNVQWIGRTAWLYPAGNLMSWGYGYPFAFAAFAGACLAIWRYAKSKTIAPGLLVLAIFGLGLFAFHGIAFSKFTRYYLPITGACGVLAAYALLELGRKHRIWNLAAPVVVGATAAWAVAVTSIYSRQHPRIEATYWIRQNVVPYTVVATETAWDEGLPLSWVPNPDGTLEPDGLRRVDLAAFDTDDVYKRLKLLQTLNATEWIFISSPRSWATIPRWQTRYPVMTAYYAALFDGRLGFDLVKEFHSYPSLGTWDFPDDHVEEALTVYDHPRVLLFKKSLEYDPMTAQEILFRVPLPRMPGRWQPRQAGPLGPQPLPVPPQVVKPMPAM